MIFNDGYYSAMDRNYYVGASDQGPITGGSINLDLAKPIYDLDQQQEPVGKLGPRQIGTGTHPMQNTLQSLNAKIREGVGKIEFEFIGQGKTNSQQPGPEAFGSKERRDMRELVEINKLRTSTHAPVHGESLGGLTGGDGGGGSGFRKQAQQKVLKEIEKAIHFAGEATRGGAVVFHTGEFPRPIIDIRERTGDKLFRGYEGENEDATVYFVDERTGDLVSSVRKNQELYEPEFITKKVNGKEYFVDVNGTLIDPYDKDLDKQFNKMPKWNEDKTRFEVKKLEWKDFEKRAEEWNKVNPDDPKTPGEMYLVTQMQNRILELKGNSLYHAQRYGEMKYEKQKLEEAIKYMQLVEDKIPEKDKWKILQERGLKYSRIPGIIPDKETPVELLKRELKEVKDSMRHTHESSASADARAREEEERLRRLKPIENVGLKRTWETIARAGMTALEHTRKNKEHLTEDIYVAPENFMPNQYGSHPDEIREVVLGSRKEMAKRLQHQGYSKEEANKLAKNHIKATLDIGHMNLWRQHFERKEGETMEEKDKRFDKWILEQTEKLAKEGIVGHIHLTDNFGYDDEHITPGQGNVPMKEFIKRMEEAGIDDFIAEPGSFNAETAMHDTWALVNGPVYGVGSSGMRGGGGGFAGFRHAHFGYAGPPNYIVGGYSPSNEWKLWSEVPLE